MIVTITQDGKTQPMVAAAAPNGLAILLHSNNIYQRVCLPVPTYSLNLWASLPISSQSFMSVNSITYVFDENKCSSEYLFVFYTILLLRLNVPSSSLCLLLPRGLSGDFPEADIFELSFFDQPSHRYIQALLSFLSSRRPVPQGR